MIIEPFYTFRIVLFSADMVDVFIRQLEETMTHKSKGYLKMVYGTTEKSLWTYNFTNSVDSCRLNWYAIAFS